MFYKCANWERKVWVKKMKILLHYIESPGTGPHNEGKEETDIG
jgi:hypothetical protein